MNFLSNAVKFTERGEVVCAVVDEPVGSGAWRVNIKVRDTGIGISPGNLERLFTDFVQADASTTRKYGGTGLGLSICAKLARLMGGEVWARSELDVGSVFGVTLVLPRGQAPEPENASEPAAEPLGQVAPHRILVAEDNRVNQRVITMMLRKLGYECTVAANGVEVLEALELASQPFTVVLMDMQMPEMDGIEATRRILERYGDASPSIVAMTANAFNEDRQRCLQAGMVGFVSKPIAPAMLRRALLDCHARSGGLSVA